MYGVRIAILLGALCLAGCANKPGSLQREWSKTMRELGVIPIFPPREDVQVGDVFVMDVHPDSMEVAVAMEADPKTLTHRQRTIRSRLGMSTRWEMLPVSRSLSFEYADRPAWPVTPTNYESILDSDKKPRLWAQPTSAAKDKVGEYWVDIYDTYHQYGDRLNRLRLVAFPEFSATTFSAADIAALVPVEAWATGFAAGASDIEAITLSVPAAESYALSVRPLLDSLTRKLDDDERARRIGLVVRSRIENGVAAFVGGYESVDRPSRQAVNLLVYILDTKQSEDEANTFLGTIAREPMPQKSEAETLEHEFELMTEDKVHQQRPLNDPDRRFVEAGITSLKTVFDEKRSAALSVEAAPLGIGSEYLRHLGTVGQESGDPNVYVVVVSEVFYARAMDISVFRRRSGDAEVAVNPPKKPGTWVPPEALPEPVPLSAEAKEPKDASGLQGTATGVPGGYVKVVARTTSTISLRRVWERPIAIGYRGVTLTVDRRSGEIVGISPVGTWGGVLGGVPPREQRDSKDAKFRDSPSSRVREKTPE